MHNHEYITAHRSLEQLERAKASFEKQHIAREITWKIVSCKIKLFTKQIKWK